MSSDVEVLKTRSDENHNEKTVSGVSLTPGLRRESGKVKEHDIFVGNLSLYTTEDRLRAFFSRFGDVADVRVLVHPESKRSRRFGFVTFVDRSAVHSVFEKKSLVLDGKEIEVKSAFKKIEEQLGVPPILPSEDSCKVFVGGINQETTETDIKEHFSKFGPINWVRLIRDQSSERHKGFCFVTFKSSEGAKSACKDKFHMLKNKKVEVSVADDRRPQSAKDASSIGVIHEPPLYSWTPKDEVVADRYFAPQYIPPQQTGGGPVRTTASLSSVRYNPYSLTPPHLPQVFPISTTNVASQVPYYYYQYQPPVLTPPYAPPSFLPCYRSLCQSQFPQPPFTYPPPVVSPSTPSPVEQPFYYLISPQLYPTNVEPQNDQ